jgi:hypothetical protein
MQPTRHLLPLSCRRRLTPPPATACRTQAHSKPIPSAHMQSPGGPCKVRRPRLERPAAAGALRRARALATAARLVASGHAADDSGVCARPRRRGACKRGACVAAAAGVAAALSIPFRCPAGRRQRRQQQQQFQVPAALPGHGPGAACQGGDHRRRTRKKGGALWHSSVSVREPQGVPLGVNSIQVGLQRPHPDNRLAAPHHAARPVAAASLSTYPASPRAARPPTSSSLCGTRTNRSAAGLLAAPAATAAATAEAPAGRPRRPAALWAA